MAGERVLDTDETGLARFAAARLDEARAVVAELDGSWRPTEEWSDAQATFDEWSEDTPYEVARLDDINLLSPDELISYSRFVALSVSGPNSTERWAWSQLRASEVDAVRLILALNAPPDPSQPRPNWIVVDGRRFHIEWLDDERNPVEARLVETVFTA